MNPEEFYAAFLAFTESLSTVLGQLINIDGNTQSNHLFASMIAYCKLELLKVKMSMNHFAIKYKLILKANQIMFKELQLLKAAA